MTQQDLVREQHSQEKELHALQFPPGPRRHPGRSLETNQHKVTGVRQKRF